MTYELPHNLTPLERRLLAYYLENETDAGRRDLVAVQLAHAEVSDRDWTGVGFFTGFSIPESAPVARSLEDGYCDVAYARHPELTNGASFMLFFRGGVVACLEGVTDTEDWPAYEDAFALL